MTVNTMRDQTHDVVALARGSAPPIVLVEWPATLPPSLKVLRNVIGQSDTAPARMAA